MTSQKMFEEFRKGCPSRNRNNKEPWCQLRNIGGTSDNPVFGICHEQPGSCPLWYMKRFLDKK